MTTFEERREYKRVKPPREMNSFSQNQLSEVIDISATGLRLKGSFVENQSEEYSLKLFTTDFQFLLTDIPAKVVWEKKHGLYLNHIKEIGVRFEGLSEEQQEQINLLLSPQLFWQSQCSSSWNTKTGSARDF
ncbi:MAG: PilZ domain-containing protein [Desulfobulbaceae bacterium]|uniref:PilZ domain-containing protein n=1 Tax=Candidatus Desulfobia pelagia TaxID=2841692 RepID=A0A8J6NA99_9BACT|nr:PilZ domain-containing protein [Candidatus Desulfobia pelagia]